MINLLPPDVQSNILYARRNTYLRRWVVATLLSAVTLAVVVGAGLVFMQRSIHSYNTQILAGQEELKAQKLDETQAQVQNLTSDLKLVVQVLQREVLFSKLLTQIGGALPNGSVLTGLSINKVQGGLDLQAGTIDYQTATQAQLNLQDPKNQIFDKADIVNIQCATDPKAVSGDPFKSQYPCTVQLRALFAKNNSFSFISGGASNAGGTKP